MVFSGYLFAFGVAALASLAGAYRASYIPDRDTRHGLVALLVLSGVWALAQIGFLTVRPPAAKVGLYIVGLIAGFATVWAWLYFCFAYADRSLHRAPTIRRTALGLFGAVVLVKLTNPLHHLYFSTEWAAYPFAHLAIQNHVLHWVTFGLAYTLSAIGVFVLFELFATVASSTRALVVLVGLTTLPALLNAAGHAGPMFLDVGHEPLGVAAFAVGVLFIYGDTFQDVHLTGTREAPALVLGGHGRIRTYNQEAAALFPALTAAKGEGKHLESVLPDLARVRREAPSLLTLETNGTTRYFSVCESQLGRVRTRPGRLLLLDEVTEQKEREETLRTAKEKAEEASRLKSAILANMKHEVRTPLTSILSFAGILKKQASGQTERYADLVLKGGERLQDTFDSVLRLSKLETGSMDVRRERVNLGFVADTTAELLRPQAEDDIMLVTDLPDAPVVGMWDEDALCRIAENLLENALKFTPEGGRVDVRVRETERNAVLEIEDTGIGIRDDDLDYIFEAFRQVDQGPKREYEGSGLGLSIVKKLVDALDGTLDVQSTPDEGSCFTVCLPKTPASEGPDVAGADDPHRTNGKRA